MLALVVFYPAVPAPEVGGFVAVDLADDDGDGPLLSSAVMTRSMIPMKNRSLNPARKARIYRTILPLCEG
jgi:hypothetical protein